MRRAPLLLLSCILACGDAGDPATTTAATTAATAATDGLTTGEASGASEATTSAPTTGALTGSSDTGDSSGGTDSTTGEPAPHVEIVDGALRIDGTPTFLYGGDLHYFRVRDKDFDAAKTRAMWAETLDAMQAASMNLVTTYVPWDYHSPGPGEFDFSGARDVGAFLKMVCDRGMHVVYKPGPLITGEWPRGFGSFGAVPQWWKLAHPEALVRDTKGALWTYSPTGDEDQRQPSYLHPTYLAAVKEWYAAALAPARPFLGGCIVAVQVDNETNMYWGDRFGGVDYSDPALAAYREFLQAKYGDIAALNARYGTQHADFGDVLPPGQAPGSGQSEWAKNPWYADWYAAGQAQVRRYLEALKQMLTDEGFAPPQALHFTNDSPFALLLGDVLLRNVLVHDGLTKNPIGVAGLDLYPKQFTTNDHLQDQPFQADYFTRLYDQLGDLATGPQAFAYAAELQGGFYAYPLLGHPKVAPEATDQLLARTIGRGLKGGSFYVIRDGLNLDGSKYDYLAAIAADGGLTPRYQVMQRWGKLLASEGPTLLQASEQVDEIAVLTNGRHAAPQGGLLDDLQRLVTIEDPALFGWLVHAGFNPAVLDARVTTPATLAKHRVVFYQNPDFIDDATATLLADYVAQGGVLVQLLWPGQRSDDFKPSPASDKLSKQLFPAVPAGSWVWPNAARQGPINVTLAGEHTSLQSYWYAGFWTQPPGDPLQPFAWEHTEPFGDDGKIVGYTVEDDAGKRVFLGANVWTRFNQDDYYTLPEEELARSRALARQIVGFAGVTPTVHAEGLRQLAWRRQAGTTAYLFVINDNAAAAKIQVWPGELGGAVDYEVQELLTGAALGTATGTTLTAEGLQVPVPALSSAVVRLRALP